jgi:hypothetical protein
MTEMSIFCWTSLLAELYRAPSVNLGHGFLFTDAGDVAILWRICRGTRRGYRSIPSVWSQQLFPCGKALHLEMKLKQVGGDRVMLLTDI